MTASRDPRTREVKAVVHAALDTIHEQALPESKWKLTIVARYVQRDGLDADILIGDDEDLEAVKKVITKLAAKDRAEKAQ